MSPACNITEEEQNARMRIGVVVFAAALGISVLLVQLGLPSGYRLGLFVPFWVAANALTSALYGT